MPLLTLLRHAKSSWEHPALRDFDRPLNDRGLRDGPRMAAFAADRLPKPDRIASSDSARTRATCQFFLEAFELELACCAWDPRIYDASVGELLEVLGDPSNHVPHLMLIGHNPGMTSLFNFLTDGDEESLPTCGLAHLDLGERAFKDIGPGCASILAYQVPKGL